MLKKLFARVGVGAATVDTILTNDTYRPGDTVQGTIEVKGGDVEQEISAITLKVMTKVKHETDDTVSYVEHAISAFKATDGFTLQPGENRSIDVSFKLHPETPLTALQTSRNQCQVWIETALDIDFAIDPSDRDYLRILPTEVGAYLIDAVSQCGYQMVKADVEAGQLHGNGFSSSVGCYQELEFKPGGFGFGRVREVEVSILPYPDATHVLIEIDRTFSGDGYLSLSLPSNASAEQVQQQIQQLIG